MQLLLATCVSLIAVANWAINFYAEYIWKHKEIYRGSKYDKTVNCNHEDPPCGINCDVNLDKGPTDKKYGDDQKVFIKDFISLDGEAIHWAGRVVHKVHEGLPP